MTIPVLTKLKEGRVLSLEKREEGTILFGEECDNWFAVSLTLSEVAELGEFLIALSREEVQL